MGREYKIQGKKDKGVQRCIYFNENIIINTEVFAIRTKYAICVSKSKLLHFKHSTCVSIMSTLRDAQGLGGRLLDARPIPEVGGARQLVLPAFLRPKSVLAILAFMAIILAP